MIAFRMGNMLLTFVDKYYEYNGKREIQDKRLTIQGYKLAWLANLVATFLLKNCEDLFIDNVIYYDLTGSTEERRWSGDHERTENECRHGEWLNTFQKRMNEVTDYKELVFTVSIWRGKEKNDGVKHPKAEIVRS
jgi:hypothetical protein